MAGHARTENTRLFAPSHCCSARPPALGTSNLLILTHLSRLKSKVMLGPVSRHLRKPGEDGYRTPAIEDLEHPGIDTSTFTSALSNGIDGPLHSPTRVHYMNQYFGHNPHFCHRKDHSDELPFASPRKLDWKQRIKHVTWAYFTVTMATGCIANVLATGTLEYVSRCVTLRANELQYHSDSMDLRQSALSSSY